MASDEWLGGYTLEQLLGAAPVSEPVKKQSLLGKLLGAPFRLVVGLVKLPFIIVGRMIAGVGSAIGEVAKLPVRFVSAILRPWRRS